MMWGYYGAPWGWMAPFGMLLFLLMFFGGIAVLVRMWWRQPMGHDHDLSDALTILERRYASGEITREEFLGARRDLTGQGR